MIPEFLRESADAVRLKWTARLETVLAEARVFFRRPAAPRPETIGIPKSRPIEPYVTFFEGDTACEAGAMSYSHSRLAEADFVLGRYCSIAWNVAQTGPRHPIERLTSSNVSYQGHWGSEPHLVAAMRDLVPGYRPVADNRPHMPICLGHDVWIGQAVRLRPGVRIGTGSVVGACALVTHDVPPYAVVGGVPATLIRWRFPEQIRTLLFASEWWAYHPSDLHRLGWHDAPEVFLERFEQSRDELQRWSPVALTWEALRERLV